MKVIQIINQLSNNNNNVDYIKSEIKQLIFVCIGKRYILVYLLRAQINLLSVLYDQYEY